MDALAYPFRFVAQRAARLNDTSEEFAAQLVASAIQTQYGEMPITRDFGSYSAEFDSFDESNLYRTVSNYFANIVVENVIQTINKDQTVSVTVEFSTIRS